MDRIQHWENVYQTKKATEVSWYEDDPKTSLDLIMEVADNRLNAIIDVGGGQSFLVDRLLEVGFINLTVLDISSTAISATKSRLGPSASAVTWLARDITVTSLPAFYDVWHDRAVFHFLTDPDDQNRYLELLKATLRPQGFFIVGTFAKEGPSKCSGLTIQQYDHAAMTQLLGNGFISVRSLTYQHRTPSGKTQDFYFGIFQKTR